MKITSSVALGTALTLSLGLLGACGGGKTKLEACKFVEVEDAEFEVELGDVDVERGEVEMVCGDKIIDVTWGEFKKHLKVDPGQYKDKISELSQQVTCYRDEKAKQKEVLCKGPKSEELLALSFSFDD